MKKIIISIILFSLFLNAQNIDDIKKQLNNSGITVDQAKSAAKSQGLTDQQIELEAKSKGIDLGEKSIKLKKNDSFEQDDPLIDELGYNDLSASDEYSNIENMSDGAIEYYGYKIFSGDPSAFQSSNFGAIHPNYNIGPGDQIIVMLWGESQFRQEFTIDREGYVFVPDVGQIFVNGLTLEALEKKFFQTLSKV